MLLPFLRPPMYRQPTRDMLVGSYQHLLLACLAGLLLCLTPVPSAAALLVTATQAWRLRTLRRSSATVLVPQPRAAAHSAGYFATAQRVLLMLLPALLAGVGLVDLWLQQVLMSLVLVLALATVWPAYRVLCRDSQAW